MVPSKVRLASPSRVFAVPLPVITLLSALLLIVVPVIVLKVWSPAKKVVELAVPLPRRAVGTVPEVRFEADKLAKFTSANSN